MLIDQFHTTITEQLTTLGGNAKVSINPETRGYTVTVYVGRNEHHQVSKFYTASAIATYSPQLVRVQISHLYNQLIQCVCDKAIGTGVLHVR